VGTPKKQGFFGYVHGSLNPALNTLEFLRSHCAANLNNWSWSMNFWQKQITQICLMWRTVNFDTYSTISKDSICHW